MAGGKVMLWLIPLAIGGGILLTNKKVQAKLGDVFGPFLPESVQTKLGEVFGPFLPMGPALPANSDTLNILARTLYGEARNEGKTGMQAVANVVMNRVAANRSSWGTGVVGVCLKRAQFSCWNPHNNLSLNDPNIVANYNAMITVTPADNKYALALLIAKAAIDGSLADITGGATYYHTTAIMPRWALNIEPIAKIGTHKFYTTSQVG